MLEKKKKIKKLNCYFCVIILICCSCITANAAEMVNDEDIYYTNPLGLELSEKEYNELLMYVDEQIIDGISVSDYEYIKNNLDTCFASSNVKYVKSTYSKSNDELIQEEYMTEEEMLDNINNRNVSTFALSDRTDTVKTEMKKITMKMTNVNASSKTVELVCEWLSIPKVKSYDVIAFRFSANVVTIDLESEKNIQGKQIYDGKIITYDYDSDNIKFLNNGLGISMNIVDSTSSTLKCTFKVVFATTQDPFFVYGTYQHAVSNVSLRESKDYTLSYVGLGNVLEFDDDVIDEYDNTPGLSVFGSLKDTK